MGFGGERVWDSEEMGGKGGLLAGCGSLCDRRKAKRWRGGLEVVLQVKKRREEPRELGWSV